MGSLSPDRTMRGHNIQSTTQSGCMPPDAIMTQNHCHHLSTDHAREPWQNLPQARSHFNYSHVKYSFWLQIVGKIVYLYSAKWYDKNKNSRVVCWQFTTRWTLHEVCTMTTSSTCPQLVVQQNTGTGIFSIAAPQSAILILQLSKCVPAPTLSNITSRPTISSRLSNQLGTFSCASDSAAPANRCAHLQIRFTPYLLA